MRVGIISDIHIDINSEYPIVDELIKQVKLKNVEVLLIAGDISEKVSITLEAIKNLENNTNAKIYFVPGNHDMWGKDLENTSTKDKYERYKASQNCICEKLITLNEDTSLIGNVGWYDYTFGNEKFSFEDFEKMSNNGRTWQDKLFNDWTRDNVKTNEWQLATLDNALAKNNSNKKILMTHMLSHEKFTVPLDWSDKIEWGYFNAFLGSRKLKDFCNEKKIDYAIMGHVHYRGVYKEHDTTYICSCLNYHSEWQSNDYKKEVEEALYLLDI